MTDRKAFMQALMTVGLAALVASGILLYMTRSHRNLWPAVIAIALIVTLILLPLVSRKYQKGPPARPTRNQRIALAVMFGVVAALSFVFILRGHYTGWRLFWQSCNAAIWLLLALNHLRLAYKKEGTASPTH
jgi:phosphoglycerol transferase MdoB-like AlkP superfamily enzyme